MPIVVLLLDGLGDRAYPELGGRTASEAAHIPHLDGLAARGASGLLHPLGRARAPSSDVAHWAILGGHPDEFPGRAVFEALGRGQRVDPADVYAYAALRPAEYREGALWVTGRAGREDAADAAQLLECVAHREVDGHDFDLTDVTRGEAILRIRGEGCDAVTDSDPFFTDLHPVLQPTAITPAAAGTAAAATRWTRDVVRELRSHPVNRARAVGGLRPLNVVTLKWWGRLRPVPPFRARHGIEGVLIAASPFLAGLAEVLGLRFMHIPDQDDPGTSYGVRIDAAAQLLRDGVQFLFCHSKAVDEAGHTKDARNRVAALERLDTVLDKLDGPEFSGATVLVTGDHATPAVPGLIHSGDPVPFVLAGPAVRPDQVSSFGEEQCEQGRMGHLVGSDVMPMLLDAVDRSLFLGSRPTAAARPTGLPIDVVPLQP
ncbi:MAG: alkaline phosphatase family protein [Geodermatophilaceae bacterium]